MAKVKTIAVPLTDQQLKMMQPLFDKVEENWNKGFIIAQIDPRGYMLVGFTTPYEVKQGMEKTIAKYAGKQTA